MKRAVELLWEWHKYYMEHWEEIPHDAPATYTLEYLLDPDAIAEDYGSNNQQTKENNNANSNPSDSQAR